MNMHGAGQMVGLVGMAIFLFRICHRLRQWPIPTIYIYSSIPDNATLPQVDRYYDATVLWSSSIQTARFDLHRHRPIPAASHHIHISDKTREMGCSNRPVRTRRKRICVAVGRISSGPSSTHFCHNEACTRIIICFP